MTVYRSGITTFQAQTTGVASKSTSPAPAAPGGTSYWYSTAGSGVADYQRWDLASADTWQFRRLVYVDTAAATDVDLVSFRTGADAGNNLIVRIQGTDKLRVVANGGTFAYTSTASFPHDGWYRLEGYGSATGNTARVALFPVGSSTPVTGIDSGDITVAQGSLAPTGVRLGKPSNATGYAGIVAWDEDEVRTGVDAALSFIGPYANAAPSVSLSGNQNVAASSAVTATATATDSDGSIASLAWSVVAASSTATPTLTGASTATVSFTAPAAGNLVTLQCIVTDNGGATATATTEVRVPVTGATTVRPLALAGTGATWTNTGGASSDGAALADASDTTYLESPSVTATETARRVRLQPRQAAATFQLPQRFATDTGTANVTFRLYEGTTVRQTWTQAITATATDYTFTASAGTVSAIADWGNLFVELGATT